MLNEDDRAVQARAVNVRLEGRVVRGRDEEHVPADVQGDVLRDAGALLVHVEAVGDAG